MVSSPDDQIASTYHFVARDAPLARICTSIHVADGVAALHDAMSRSKAKGVRTGADVQVPRSSATVPPYGSR
jgi:hypothetical protein